MWTEIFDLLCHEILPKVLLMLIICITLRILDEMRKDAVNHLGEVLNAYAVKREHSRVVYNKVEQDMNRYGKPVYHGSHAGKVVGGGAPKEEYECVNHPNHYNRNGLPEAIEVEELLIGDDGSAFGCWFSIIKYLYRKGEKPGEPEERDAAKTDWYFERLDDYNESGIHEFTTYERELFDYLREIQSGKKDFDMLEIKRMSERRRELA